jgi:hypothetical protein
MSGMKRSVRSERAWAKWRRLVEAQEASGLSVHRFCEDRGIPASSLFAWRRKLRDADAAPGPRAAARRPAFVEVVRERAIPGAEGVERMGRSDLCRGVVGSGRGGVVVELASGRRIVLERGFDRGLLVAVIEVLEHVDRVSIGGGAGMGSLS